MVKMILLYGHPDDPAAFEEYYHHTHLPVARKGPNVRLFELATVLKTADGGQPPYYRTAELWFDSVEDADACVRSNEGQAWLADFPNFATGGVTVLVTETE
jgi:uncharacterized protein (TIGR02118 family)